MPRTVREWHPIEEFTAFMLVAMSETDRSLSVRDRLVSTLRLRSDFSEGFQGGEGSRSAGKLNLVPCAVIIG